MKKLLIASKDPGHARVLEDLIRSYFPGITLLHCGEEPEQGEIEISAGDDWGLLKIEEIDSQGFSTLFQKDGRRYRGASRGKPGDENQRRRMLRLSVHRALAGYLAEKEQLVSPWGVLTGVRPSKIVHRLRKQGYTNGEICRILEEEYGVKREKAELAAGVVEVQEPYLTDLQPSRAVSIYISIPFCPSRCHYCSFPAFALSTWGHLLEGYLQNLSREIGAVAGELANLGLEVQTLYMGGGTPTVLSARQLADLLALLGREFRLEEGREITVEAGRPDTLDREKLEVLKNYGVNRISINPQTLHDCTLAAIGRAHQAADIYHIYRQAREIGFPVINMDLIVGLPGENRELLAETLERVIQLGPENITLHDLALKRAAYFKQVGVKLPSSHEGAAMTALAQQKLIAAGYQAYYLYRQKEILGHGENVGFCLPGTASLYNILMMEELQTILGLGVGAGSKIVDPADLSVDNFYNPKDLLVYQERLEGIIVRKVDKLRSFVYNGCS